MHRKRSVFGIKAPAICQNKSRLFYRCDAFPDRAQDLELPSIDLGKEANGSPFVLSMIATFSSSPAVCYLTLLRKLPEDFPAEWAG